LKDQSELIRLLEKCGDALYHVYEWADSFQFNIWRYKELSLECYKALDQIKRMQWVQDALVDEALEDFENEICGECLFIDDCHKWHYKCPAYKILMEFEK